MKPTSPGSGQYGKICGKMATHLMAKVPPLQAFLQPTRDGISSPMYSSPSAAERHLAFAISYDAPSNVEKPVAAGWNEIFHAAIHSLRDPQRGGWTGPLFAITSKPTDPIFRVLEAAYGVIVVTAPPFAGLNQNGTNEERTLSKKIIRKKRGMVLKYIKTQLFSLLPRELPGGRIVDLVSIQWRGSTSTF